MLTNPDLDNIDLAETLQVLSELRSLDLQTVNLDVVKSLLRKLYKHIGVRHKLEKGRYVQRGVFLDGEEDDYFPSNLQRISYNPNGSKAGRANFDGESVFYSCIATEVMEGYNCTGMELLPRYDTGIHKHRIIVGNWILQQDQEFVFIGGAGNLTYLSNAAKGRHERLKEFVVNFKNSAIALYAIDKFLCHEFSKEVAADRPWEYKISAAYASLLQEFEEPGLIYPSVKSAGAGLNLIIFKGQVDNGLIEFQRAVYGTYYIRDKYAINEYTMGATCKDGKLVWHEVYHRLPPIAKNYYTGKTDYNPTKNVETIDLGSGEKAATDI